MSAGLRLMWHGAPKEHPRTHAPISDSKVTRAARQTMTSSTTEPDAAAAGDAPTPQHTATPSRSRARRIAVLVWPAFAVYALTTAAHLLVLSAMIPAGGPSLQNRLTTWDGGLYLDVAAHGYRHALSYDTTGKSLAFFPLYPMLTRAVHEVTRLSVPMSGIVAANLALVAALIVTLLLFCRLYGRRTAVIAITLLAGAQPMSLVFLMSYSESLFLALAAGMLLAAHRRAWLTAGLLALLVGLTRPAAVAAVVALGVAALLHLLRERRVQLAPARRPATRLRWNPALPAMGGPAGRPGRRLVPDPGRRLAHQVGQRPRQLALPGRDPDQGQHLGHRQHRRPTRRPGLRHPGHLAARQLAAAGRLRHWHRRADPVPEQLLPLQASPVAPRPGVPRSPGPLHRANPHSHRRAHPDRGHPLRLLVRRLHDHRLALRDLTPTGVGWWRPTRNR